MNDTTKEMHQYQYNLIMGKTPEERFIMGLEMMEMGRELMITGIKSQNPELNENEVLFQLIMRKKKYDKSLYWLDYMIPEIKKAYNIVQPSHNITPSQQRAEAVRNYLISKGITENRVTAKGYANTMPIYTGNENLEKNRRVEFKIIEEEQSVSEWLIMNVELLNLLSHDIQNTEK